MKNLKILFCAGMLMLVCCTTGFTDEVKNAEEMEKADLFKQISYALGFDVFEKIKKDFDLDPEYFIQGIKDNHAKQPKMTSEQRKDKITSYKDILGHQYELKIKKETQANKTLGVNFLKANKNKEGVVVLPSGLQYKILKKGNGTSPLISETVECHYKGNLIDGTVFDSSYQRGKPAIFQVNSVIQGWIEALQLMKAGSKWRLFIPPDLAYGDRGAGSAIKPGETLIFEVEILKIVK